jgi:hypothetical protein
MTVFARNFGLAALSVFNSGQAEPLLEHHADSFGNVETWELFQQFTTFVENELK